MTVRFNEICCLTAALAMHGAGNTAFADILSETQSVANWSEWSPWILESGQGQHTFAQLSPTVHFMQFDPSLGSLEGVTITVQTGVTNLLELVGDHPAHIDSSGVLKYSFDWLASITPPGATAIADDHRMTSETFDTFLTWSGHEVHARPPTGNSVPSTYTVDPADFAFYSGTGTAPFLLTFDAEYNWDDIWNCNARFRVMSRATLTVEYEYTPVPSPAAAAPLFFVGLMASRRRRV